MWNEQLPRYNIGLVWLDLGNPTWSGTIRAEFYIPACGGRQAEKAAAGAAEIGMPPKLELQLAACFAVTSLQQNYERK